MAAVLDGLKQEWHAFKASAPGHRFAAHHHRAQTHSSHAGRIARAGLGVVLVAVGLVMLVTPGPGIVLLLFGLGLLATTSGRLARALDRVEPRARAGARSLHAWWSRRGAPVKVVIAGAAALVAGAVVLAMAWRFLA